MKPKHLIVFAALLLFSGCRNLYIEYNYLLNVPQTVYLGEPIFSATVGRVDDRMSYYEKLYTTELIYAGMSDSILNITYAEYEYIKRQTKEQAGFVKTLYYDLTKSDTISYNLTRIKVLKASRTELSYYVITSATEGYLADSAKYEEYMILHKPVLRR